jgi:methylmalonyl-CoA/ethylmalonyl-CoA epimerase
MQRLACSCVRPHVVDDKMSPPYRLEELKLDSPTPRILTRLHHVGIAVWNVDEAVERYRRALGLEEVHREVGREQGVNEVLLDVGSSYIQLLEPLGADTPVGRFLDRRGEGVHHLAYHVDDLEQSLGLLREAGIRLIDERPRAGGQGSHIAFVHPKGLHGVLIELVQAPAAD